MASLAGSGDSMQGQFLSIYSLEIWHPTIKIDSEWSGLYCRRDVKLHQCQPVARSPRSMAEVGENIGSDIAVSASRLGNIREEIRCLTRRWTG